MNNIKEAVDNSLKGYMDSVEIYEFTPKRLGSYTTKKVIQKIKEVSNGEKDIKKIKSK